MVRIKYRQSSIECTTVAEARAILRELDRIRRSRLADVSHRGLQIGVRLNESPREWREQVPEKRKKPN